MNNKIIKFRNLSKKFTGVQALKNITFEINKGEIHAIVGENGAGKSTLIKILGGVYNDFSGDVFIDNKEIRIINPKISKNLGIRIVYQEIPLCDNLDIAGNIFLGSDLIRNKAGFLKWQDMYMKASKSLSDLGIKIDARTKVGELPIGMRQIVEIVKAISKKAKIIIMDEPTSALNAKEVIFLFKLINNLKEKGITIIYISHHLEEVFKIADRITVLRDGNYVDSFDKERTSLSNIVKSMTGRKEKSLYVKKDNYSEKINVLKLRDIKLGAVLNGINFDLKKKEVLGLAGLVGSGTDEIMRILFGIEKQYTGDIYYNNKKFLPRNSMESINNGFGFIPSDRRLEGLIEGDDISRNISFPFLRKIQKKAIIDEKKLFKKTEEMIEELNIKISNTTQAIKNLSGGNQQKVVVAKWLAASPKLLLMNNPTRGVDVGARSEIYSIIDKLVKRGISIIVTSTELEDIITVCDRIIVFYKGKAVIEFNRKELNKDKLLLYCTSGREKLSGNTAD